MLTLLFVISHLASFLVGATGVAVAVARFAMTNGPKVVAVLEALKAHADRAADPASTG